MLRHLMVCIAAVYCFGLALVAAAQAKGLEIKVGYLELYEPPPPVLSNLDPIPEDEGLVGAQLALKDNQTTGKFLKQNYSLSEVIVDDPANLESAAKELLAEHQLIVLKMPKDALLKVADLPEAENAILFNARAAENTLRGEACRSNLVHTIPSRAMLADALMQFATKKRWNNLALIHGVHEDDLAFASAIETSAAKFRANIVAKKEWAFDADMRRNAAQEVPLFTQDFDAHDVLLIADERRDFGRYVIFNTWLPRPVAGSEGMVASAWSSAVEQHGAAQLQSRFEKLAGRDMRGIDYAAWLGVRMIGEAVTRTNSADPETLRSFMLSDKFQMAGFKGRPLTVRGWNGQVRQPIPLSHPGAVVALAPLEGFLHQRNELDTLGIDQPESNCTQFAN